MKGLCSLGLFVARLLMSIMFIWAGIGKIIAFGNYTVYMAAKGLPVPAVFLVLAIIVEILFGVLLLVGYKTRIAAAVLALYLIPVTLIFHAFWEYTDTEKQLQIFNFLKNIAIIGGLLSFVCIGSGGCSLDARDKCQPE